MAFIEFLMIVGRRLLGVRFVDHFARRLFLLLGFATRYTTIVMLIFTIVAAFSSHAYWSAPEAQRVNQAIHFWKNVSIMGGIIVLFVSAAGRLSIDNWLRTRR